MKSEYHTVTDSPLPVGGGGHLMKKRCPICSVRRSFWEGEDPECQQDHSKAALEELEELIELVEDKPEPKKSWLRKLFNN